MKNFHFTLDLLLQCGNVVDDKDFPEIYAKSQSSLDYDEMVFLKIIERLRKLDSFGLDSLNNLFLSQGEKVRHLLMQKSPDETLEIEVHLGRYKLTEEEILLKFHHIDTQDLTKRIPLAVFSRTTPTNEINRTTFTFCPIREKGRETILASVFKKENGITSSFGKHIDINSNEAIVNLEK